MRIVDTTPARLTLEARPWVLGTFLILVILLMLLISLITFAVNAWLGAGMLMGAALFGVMFVAFVRRVIVIFDRAAGAVVIRTASLMGQTETTLPLTAIRQARVDTSINRTSRTSGGRSSTSRTYRTVLVTGDGEVPLTQIFSGGDGAARNAAEINAWLGVAPPPDPGDR